MSTRNAELVMAIGMLVLSLGLMWTIHSDGLVIGWMEERGPGWVMAILAQPRYGAMFGLDDGPMVQWCYCRKHR